MNTMLTDFSILWPALIAGVLVAISHVPLGQQVLSRGIVFIDLAIAQVAGLGVIAAKANLSVKRPEGDSSASVILDGPFLVPAGTSVAIDPRLNGAHVVPARFRPVGKLPNYFGLPINRMPAIPGVMRYDRDRIVDLTAAN